MKKKWFGSLLASTALVAALASSQAFAATNDGWVQSGNQWNLYQEGKLVKAGWAKDKGTWYFFDNNGVMQTGWVFTGGAWYSLNGDGAMRTGWYQEGNTWYYLSDQGDMQTGWTKVGDKWSYFESNGSMLADQPVKASDGRSYVIGKDGYMLTDTPYHLVSELYRMGGDYYLLHKSKDGVYIAQNEWFLESNARLGKAGYNLLDTLVDHQEPGGMIDPDSVVKGLNQFMDRFYFGENGKRVEKLPEMSITSTIVEKNNEFVIDNFNPRLSILGHFTIVNNKLYVLKNPNEGTLRPGYKFLLGQSSENGYNLLVLANKQGEVISMKRLSKDVSDFNKKDMAGLANDRIMIDINQTEDQMVRTYH